MCSVSFEIYGGARQKITLASTRLSLPLMHNQVPCDLALSCISVHSFPWPMTSIRTSPQPPTALGLHSLPYLYIVFLGFQHCLSHRYYCVTPVVKTFNGFLIVHPLSTGQIQILLISLKDQSKSGQNTFLVLLIEAALIPDSLFKCRFQPFSPPPPIKTLLCLAFDLLALGS